MKPATLLATAGFSLAVVVAYRQWKLEQSLTLSLRQSPDGRILIKDVAGYRLAEKQDVRAIADMTTWALPLDKG